MVVVPAPAPAVTNPDEEPIVAAEGMLLTHVPAVGVALKVVVVEIQMESDPEITGVVFTETVLVTIVPPHAV